MKAVANIRGHRERGKRIRTWAWRLPVLVYWRGSKRVVSFSLLWIEWAVVLMMFAVVWALIFWVV
jgi:hypothetical protein